MELKLLLQSLRNRRPIAICCYDTSDLQLHFN